MQKIDVKKDFRQEGKWILPVRGTMGRKAQNLLDNSQAIKDWNFEIADPSLVIPFEYYDESPESRLAVQKIIKHFFPNTPLIGVSSNSPDEDVGERIPGLYSSRAISIEDDRLTFGLQAVINSYYSQTARILRQRRGLPEQGMSLLVRPFINATFSGSFSYFGDKSLLTFTNPEKGMDSMQSPNNRTLWVDENGEIYKTQDRFSGDDQFSGRLHRLATSLPRHQDKGWEIEFLATTNDRGIDAFYIMQTTPIKKLSDFQVTRGKNPVFHAHDMTGFGEFVTDGLVYLPVLRDNEKRGMVETLTTFNQRCANYALLSLHVNIKNARELIEVSNAKVLFDIYDLGGPVHPLSAHLSQQFRQNGSALVGSFLDPKLSGIELMNLELKLNFQHNSRNLRGMYSPTRIRTQVNEFKKEAYIEAIGEVQPFVPISAVL
jgi:hypothetical protein